MLGGPTRYADAELLHARLQCGPMHAQEGRGAVGSGYLPVGFLESGDDALPFGVVKTRPQILTAGMAHWRRIGTKVQFVRRHPENSRAGQKRFSLMLSPESASRISVS